MASKEEDMLNEVTLHVAKWAMLKHNLGQPVCARQAVMRGSGTRVDRLVLAATRERKPKLVTIAIEGKSATTLSDLKPVRNLPAQIVTGLVAGAISALVFSPLIGIATGLGAGLWADKGHRRAKAVDQASGYSANLQILAFPEDIMGRPWWRQHGDLLLDVAESRGVGIVVAATGVPHFMREPQFQEGNYLARYARSAKLLKDLQAAMAQTT